MPFYEVWVAVQELEEAPSAEDAVNKLRGKVEAAGFETYRFTVTLPWGEHAIETSGDI